MTSEFFAKFRDPPAEYRPQYFWFLNHRLELPELKRQLTLMKQQGAGGAFLHARTGRLTPYMSEEWLSRCTGAIQYAAEIGLKAWLYDEDGFPSGYAGGKTLEPNPKDFAANFIVLTDEFEVKPREKITLKIRFEHPTSEIYGVLATPVRENTIGYEIVGFPQNIIDLTNRVRVDEVEWAAPAQEGVGTWLILVFLREWNLAAANVLSSAAMRVFIAETHQKYEEYLNKTQLNGYLGSVVPGIFTDEPGVMYCLGDKGWRRIIPYTPEMEKSFPERFGLTLLVHLPAVFFDIEGDNPQYRLNYWESAGNFYQEAFFHQIYEWCDKRGLAFMGHVANEGNLFNQVRDQVDFFKGARFMHFGCSDQLGATYRAEFEKSYTLANCDNMVAPCFAASAARIFNLPRVDSECFGSAGWELSLADQKRLVDWQVAQGVNLFIPHSFNYSMMGGRKRDHPPAFNACAYFDEIHVLNDYIGRLCYLFAQPQVASLPRIAFLYGNLTILANMTPLMGNTAAAAHDAQPYVIDILQRLHLDFDIIPEDYLASLRASEGILSDGRNSYAIVIVASLETVHSKTVEVLIKFFDAGGKILFIQNIPRRIYGNVPITITPLLEIFTISPESLDKSLNQQAAISGLKDLFIKNNPKGGMFGFLQAPRLPIFKNHLLAAIEEFCVPAGIRVLSVSPADTSARRAEEIGDIVVRRSDVGKTPRTTLLFIANVSGAQFSNVSIWVKGTYKDERFWKNPTIKWLNPLEGSIQLISRDDWTIDEGGNLTLNWDIDPEESIVLMVSEDEPASQYISLPRYEEKVNFLTLAQWNIIPTRKNILSLSEWQSKFFVEKMNIERPSYLQSCISQAYWINIEDVPSECRLILDGITKDPPHSLSVEINGKKVPKLVSGEILDHTMLESSNISSLLTKGRNQINVLVQGHLSTPLYPLTEPVRLYGDFTARRNDSGEWVLTKWQKNFQHDLTDFRDAGFPHYIFPLDYETTFQIPSTEYGKWKYSLHLPIQNKPLYKVWINSQEQGHIWFGNYTLLLRDIQEGINHLKIRYFPFPTNLYESSGTPLGILGTVQLKKIKKS